MRTVWKCDWQYVFKIKLLGLVIFVIRWDSVKWLCDLPNLYYLSIKPTSSAKSSWAIMIELLSWLHRQGGCFQEHAEGSLCIGEHMRPGQLISPSSRASVLLYLWRVRLCECFCLWMCTLNREILDKTITFYSGDNMQYMFSPNQSPSVLSISDSFIHLKCGALISAFVTPLACVFLHAISVCYFYWHMLSSKYYLPWPGLVHN